MYLSPHLELLYMCSLVTRVDQEVFAASVRGVTEIGDKTLGTRLCLLNL